MRTVSRGICLSLLLVMGMCWILAGRHLKAAAAEPAIQYIYQKTEESGTQIIIISLQAEDRIEGAVLSWETAEGTRTAEAVEVVDGYAAFLMQEAVEESSLFSLTVEQDGQSYLLDAKAFRQEADTVPLEADGEEEELPVAETAEEIRNVLGEAEGEALAAGTEQVLSLGELPGTSLNKTDGDVVVVLDPGHGGSDAGAWRTWNGRTYIEKEINLKIAQYTKQELETYEGVRVYMTRDTDVYLTLDERVDYAASVGATVLVSQHINSTPENETTAEGAEVMVSRGYYRPAQAEETGRIARAILVELEGIGFSNRDLVYRLSETGNTYPNKKPADYYGIVRLSVLAGFPGMIVEHGFVSNPEDCKKYYRTEERLQKVGQADAAALAKYYGLRKRGVEGWNQEDGKWFYVNAQGERMPAGWLELNGVRYYLDENGYRVTGWQTLNGQKYYFDSQGVMKRGTASIDGKLYYFGTKGAMYRSFKKGFDGRFYYARKNGVLRTGWQTIGKKTYYFDGKTGASMIGWAKIGRYHYYFGSNGRMKKGMQTLEEGTYYLDKNGRRMSGFVTYKAKKYYFRRGTGQLQKRVWIKEGQNWYDIGKNGYAIQSARRIIDGMRFRFDRNGVCLNR